MANALYDAGRQGFLDGSIDWDTDNIKAILIDAGAYTVDLANHSLLTDIPVGARVATSANLTNKTTTAGVADADDVTWAAVSNAAPTIEAVALYKDTGVAGTSRLIAYLDTVTGLPMQPSGADIQIVWDNGANKIFKL